MPKPFDATTKTLVDLYPEDWLARFNLPYDGPVEVIDMDLSLVSAAADKGIRVGGRNPWIFNLELLASRSAGFVPRFHAYSALTHSKHELPVTSGVLLLRREAEDSRLTGLLEYGRPGDPEKVRFPYRVERAWEWPVESVLEGGLGTLPLAPLSDVRESDLPEVIRRMQRRLTEEVEPARAGDLWAAATVLMGLSYSEGVIEMLLQKVTELEESTVYQKILNKGINLGLSQGQLIEARKLLILIGGQRFGAPDARMLELIDSIDSLSRVDRMMERLLAAADWSDLLSTG